MLRFVSEELKEEIKTTVNMEELLEFFDVYKERNGKYYSLQVEEETPSCVIYNNYLMDFSRGFKKGLDVFEVYSILSGLNIRTNYIKIADDLLKFRDGELTAGKKNIVKKISKNIYNTPNSKYELSHSYKTIGDAKREEGKSFAFIYLNKRCIDYNNIKEFLSDNKIVLRFKYKFNHNFIIVDFEDYSFSIERSMDDYLKGDKERIIENRGSVKVFNTKEVKGDLYIFEGFFDMISFISNMDIEDQKNNSFMCLNSCSNYNKIDFEYIKKFDNVIDVIDDDETGRKTSKEIQEKAGKEFIRFDLMGYKDYNEMIQKIRED